MNLVEFLILALATWRLSSMLAGEEGPGGVFGKIRYRLGVRASANGLRAESMLGRGIICMWCNSVWVGGAMATLAWVDGLVSIVMIPVLALALSTGAIMTEELISEEE